MNQDVPGYAYISGGEQNGQYVNATGQFFRRQGNTMYAVEDGLPAPDVDAPRQPVGQVVGAVDTDGLRHPNDSEIANRTRYSSEGVDEVLRASVNEDVGAEEQKKPDPEGEVAGLSADGLVADYSAVELQGMAAALKEKLDGAGVENDIEVLEGDDETSVRLNAESIAKYASA